MERLQIQGVTNSLGDLEKAREEKPDLILIEVSPTMMDGFEVIHRLKADPQTHTIPILAVTAKAMPGGREICLESGCDGYLTKPTFALHIDPGCLTGDAS